MPLAMITSGMAARFRFLVCVAIFLCLLLIWSSHAQAQGPLSFEEIATAGEAAHICKPLTGQRRVDPILLSELVLRRLDLRFDAIFQIAEANKHIPPTELPRAILLEARPGDPLYVDIGSVDAQTQGIIQYARTMIDDYLTTPSSRLPDALYRVMPADAIIDEQTVIEARQAILRDSQSIWIACQAKAQRSLLESRALSRFRLRGRITDLATQRNSSKFNGLQPAEFSLLSNQKADQTTAALSFVAGYALDKTVYGEDETGIVESTYSVIPFVSYELTDIKGGSEENSDVHQITPGMQFAWGSNNRLLGFIEQVALDLSATFDEEQDARSLGAQTIFDLNPTVTSEGPSTGRKTRTSYCFSDYIVGEGPLGIHCSPRAIIDFRHVLDAGTSPDLEDDKDDEILGLGGEIGIRAFLGRTTTFDPGVLENFSLAASFRFVGIIAGSLGNQERLRVALSYEFPTVRFLEWTISYETGNNIQTFQDEELARLSLGIKF